MQPPGVAALVELGGICAGTISCDWWLTVYFPKRTSFSAIDKPACRALPAHTGKRSPREATCPRIASGLFREGRFKSAISLICSQTFPHLILASSRWDEQLRLVQDRDHRRFKSNGYLNGGLP